MPKGTPNAGTSIDLAAAPLHWMCHGCGAGFAEKPERCKKCGGYAFERVGGENHLREIAEAVAEAIDREITIDEYGETVMGARGPRAKMFGAEHLAERIKAAKAKAKTKIFLTTKQAEQIYRLLGGKEAG
jgi:predicted  nucleic acid-binding Zn-ribbon protein